LVFTLLSCNRESDPSSQADFSVSEDAFSLTGEGFSSEDEFALANDAAIEAAFTLDYRPQGGENGQEAETLSAGALAGASAGGEGDRDTVIGGGLRKLADYQTKYFDPAAERENIRVIQAAQAAAARSSLPERAGENAGPLTVIDWGPRGEFSASVQRPSVYVIFSQPMIPLASLGESGDSPPVSIEPPMRGKFRWYGTSFLSFEGDEPCRSQEVYTITVNSEAASIYGTKISGETSFSFTTETLSLREIIKGEDFVKRTGFRFSDREVPPDAARELTLVFNYPVSAEDVGQYLEISTAAGGPKRFTLSQTGPERIRADIGDPVEFATIVRVTLKAGLKSAGGRRGTAEDQTVSFNTPWVFGVKEYRRIPGYGKYRNLVELEFSQRLNESTLAPALSVEPLEPEVFPGDFVLGPGNIEIWGSTVRIGNLPVTYGDRYRITLSGDLEDVYGRKLGAPYSCEITLPEEPPPEGEVRFLGWRHHMLEAQFPPRFLFEYRNIAPDSWYLLAKSKNPWADVPGDFTRRALEPGTPNNRYFEEMDLSPFLDDRGKGFVQFRVDINLLTSRKDRSGAFVTDNRTNAMNLQVTDLGLTVRYGFNKTVALVSSLATGEPVEGATVKLLSPDLVKSEDSLDIDGLVDFGSAVTDKNGLAVIGTPASRLRNNTRTAYGFESPFVYAEKDGDRAVFSPSSHNKWSFGINGQSPQRAEEITGLTFMFSDRGLYKPGEKLTFRGVDRGKILGMYVVYQGDYTVSLEEDRADKNDAPVRQLSGTVTESGGFYGSMDIPDDLNPGQYRLVYRRDGMEEGASRSGGPDRRILANIPVTVAYFERLKFRASLSRPDLALISGEDITLNLQAAYLSGGSLSGASWESAWYREQTAFHPGTPETRNYVFGPRRVGDGKRYIAGDRGMLGGNGTASLSQKTGEGGAVSGAAYLYQAEARVTDISNQMVTAYRSVLVHPARFSIGLYRKTGGFARSGEELSVDYITVDPSGEKTRGNALFLKNGEDAGILNAELIREEWRRVQQPGVNGYIYDQYLREQVSESSQKLEIRDKGTIRVKPSAAGFYTLRVSGQDRDGKIALTELSFYVTGSGSGYWNMNNTDEIRLTPDQEMYNPGDTARILLQSNLPAGYYLITLEREGIFTEEVRRFTEPVSVIDVPVARNYVPVVYVSVSSYSVRSGPPSHEYGGVDLDKPKGYYGAVKLLVNPHARSFSIKIESDKKIYRPGEEATVTLSAEQDGKPLPGAELTLMAVDRGVLDLIDYHVQDPVGYFYDTGRFPLAVNGGDSRSMLLDPVTYSVKNLAGGDGEGESKLEERKDFNPTAVFEPMLRTGADGKVRHTFKLPDSLTTYRVTVFGVRGDIFALKESEIAAQNRINVREVLPRRLRERDTAELGVLITNLDTASHRLTVKLDIGEPDQSGAEAGGRRKIPGAAFVDGPGEQQLTLRAGGNAVVYFDVAAVREGTVSLRFTVNSDILNERLTSELLIEHPYVRETVSLAGSVNDGSPANTEGVVIPSFADKGAGSFSVSLDATRLGLLKSAVQYLFHYPYGCLEQRSAAVMPLVVFGEYLESFDLHTEVSSPVKVVEEELKFWAKSQLPGGGFPYWPSGLEPNFYVSLRIAHIIALAGQKGIPLPDSLKPDLLASYLEWEDQETQKLKPAASSYYYQSYQQAYMLYVLALLGAPVDASRLAEILLRDNVDPSVLAFAGMSYRLLGRDAEAAETAGKLRNLIRFTTRGADITDPLEKNRYSFYGGKAEQLALTLQFFVEQFPGDQINGRLLHSLLENRRAGGGYWENTAVTVRVLSAVDALIRAENLGALDLEASVSLGGRGILEASFKGLGAKPLGGTFDLEEFPLAGLTRDSAQALVINRGGKGNLYYTASLTYAIPSELQSFRDEGVGVFLSIYDVDTGEETDGAALKSGKTYRARVRVSSSRDRTWLALRVPVPSGAEILDAAFVTTASYGDKREDSSSGASPLSYQTIMDNEIQYFWDQFDQGETSVSFLFRGVRRGIYPTPPVQAECMYEPEIFGRSSGLIYTIE
jgi:uncharacterized protein YfaS (alpha-2-macroglobulin family)